MPAAFIPGMPPVVTALHQEGLLERAFHESLYPQLLFRSEAMREEAEANIGTSIFMTRRGLLPAITRARRASDGEVQPQQLNYEQWVATLERYQGAIDTSITEARHALADTLGSNLQALGEQAGQSINLIARNALYGAYTSGHTTLIDAGLSGDVTIHVSSLNGFRFVVTPGTNVAPAAVSSAIPLVVSIAGVTGTRNVIAAAPDDSNDPDGPGVLTLSASLGAGVAARSAVLSSARPRILRAGGGTSVDAIGASDIVTLQDFINATIVLRNNRVAPHPDGTYHCHVPNDAHGQVFADPAFQRLNTALPDGERYQTAFLGRLAGITFYANTECPSVLNAGDTKATGSNALYSAGIHAETVNEGGTSIGRAIVTGRNAMYERWFDAKKYVSEAGMNGQQGEFAVTNNGIGIDTEGVRLVIRSPVDRAMDIVSALWDITTCFPVPSDVAAGGPEFYKRGVTLEFALS